ncbi:glycosyl hydrolase family 28 protein [Anaerocolumna sp. AGMB13025]|uniref:glycosyl hydrolase family 28 protein n=1 Tax=Anaerocolumna sp. AGMB13025 TaxID=3039116 RepID=UPI0024202D39|nr:glycosyl hydrolase family 28 protein [Anaerocolumna sp. AGMB13025]WFR59733.1 glycosyl hydrolase family 28 protein [Anaerocolumna sp. AGMB13025]
MEGKKTRSGVSEWIFALVLLILCGGIFTYIHLKAAEVKQVISLKDAKLVLYEGPKSLKDATAADLINTSEKLRDFSLMHCTDTKISVNGYDCYVYDTNVNHTRSWVPDYMPPQSRTPVAYFDFARAAKVEVKVPSIDIDTVKISPVSYGIKPEIDKENHQITFMITKPDTYTITFNDSASRAVHIFANPIETDVPLQDDGNVVYIGPGEWNIGSIMLEDNQTLYISGGAVIHGIVNANYAKNITVCGRGIIDGSKLEGWLGKNAYIPLKFDNCDNITIKDVIVLNPNAWVCAAKSSTNGVINGVKIISSRPNGDGISLSSCKNYQISNCFVRSWDDSLVVKNYEGNSENITFKNMQLWTDLAQSMEVGYETNKGNRAEAAISKVNFEDITVLNNFHKPVISIHNADDALVSNISFKNITVENAQMGSGDGEEAPYLIDLNIVQNSNWSTTKERGQVRNISIDGVKVLSGKFNASHIGGFDESHTVDGVSIKNLEILGERITSFEQGKFEIDAATAKNLTLE